MISSLRLLLLTGLCCGMLLAGLPCLVAGQVRAAPDSKTSTIPCNPPLYRDVQEAARELQTELIYLRLMVMVPSDRGGYDAEYVPIQAFTLDPRTLTLKYRVRQIKEGSGVIFTRPAPLHFSTQNSEEVEKTKTFPLENIRLTGNIMTPQPPKEPLWRLWVIIPSQSGLPDINTLGAPTQIQAEVLYRSLLSLMAAAGNPLVPKDKIPPTLSFVTPASPPGRSDTPKLGLAILPVPAAGEKGLRLTDVEKGSPADRAGLRAGDVLLAVNGIEVRNAPEVAAALRPQENLLTLARDGKIIEVRLVTSVSF